MSSLCDAISASDGLSFNVGMKNCDQSFMELANETAVRSRSNFISAGQRIPLPSLASRPAHRFPSAFLMPAPHQRQPWPMKWIVVAILLLIVPYTIITLRYRKTEPAFRPYEDLKNRTNVTRLLAAGYQRIPIVAQRPADGARTNGGAAINPSAGGLPADLRTTLVEPLLLPAEILNVAASPTATTLQPYVIQ